MQRIFKKISGTGVFIAYLLLPACGVVDSPEDDDIRDIDSDIQVSFVENLTQSERTFSLFLVTEKVEYPMENLKISLDRAGGGATVLVEGLVLNLVGMPGQAPATGSIELGTLPAGTFLLRFLIRNSSGSETIFRIQTSDRLIQLQEDISGSFKFEHTVYCRIPPYTIWGHLDCRTEAYVPMAYSFLDSLKSQGAGPAALLPGYYHKTKGEDHYSWQDFEIDLQGNIHPVRDEWLSNSAYEKIGFYLHWEGDLETIENLVKHYAISSIDSSYSPSLPMMNPLVYTWTGYRFFGHTLLNSP